MLYFILYNYLRIRVVIGLAEDNYRKIKLLKLMELLRQETDEQHPMKKTEVCRRLGEMGIDCDVRTLGRDVKVLRDQGYEIMDVMISHDKAYYIADRSFSVPELKILMDAVQAASFVTDKKAAELIEKIADLGGSHKAAILKSNIVKFNTRKHTNETIYYTVGFIEDAIQRNKKIIFRYFDLNENGEKVYRRDGHHYVVEPVALVFNEDNYYLIVYSEKHDNTANYRVDRIDAVEILDDPVSDTARALRRKVARYTETAFKMFNGQPETVTLDWFLPRAREMHRVLKDSGSFVLNISDKIVGKYQDLFVFKLVVALCEEVGFHLVRDYIWYNPATPPNVFSRGTMGRTKKSHEYCFWFSKSEEWTFNMDPIRKPYSSDMQRFLEGKGKGDRSENTRPSRHNFKLDQKWTNHGGSDPGSVLTIGNTSSNDSFHKLCKEAGIRDCITESVCKADTSSIRYAFLCCHQKLHRFRLRA